ncbi:MAG TPA: NusG domain II-containing protein [Halanaerobiaceae bacterium]|jgi:hypothetical protein|nr:NusG domain II-containing protein [Bacillota bacterium]HHU93097.1 NusG domain II-containing protein [Halanaerobiaceae bacterium]HOA41160.1 NusG domain II-containing protein [Halanaerobiales bacterium]HPZ63218.1 NusG domain II-containing protein [Halanaerobiales bacterium]HQD04444.1 NusG domain II-containing protein [Halanaerobiales bacterium]
MKDLWHYLTRNDKILILFLLVLSLSGILFPFNPFQGKTGEGTEMFLVIQKGNQEEIRFGLESTYGEPLYIEVEGPIGISIIEASNGKVRMKEAPPDDLEKTCVKTGWIENPGPMIICIPNQISIWIEAEETGLDGVSW